mmetsp:Transcript_3432/g.5321  ORF Transcript_3432/g.5321 Transcript_3432/m.5321 type:complete len:496 (-) Transcript_3432:211-1698(-)
MNRRRGVHIENNSDSGASGIFCDTPKNDPYENYKAFFDSNIPAVELEDSNIDNEQDEVYHPSDHKRARGAEEKNEAETYIQHMIKSKSRLDLEIPEATLTENTKPNAEAEGKKEHQEPGEDERMRIKEGFLKKRSHGIGHGWQKRWFYLMKNKLIYFKRGKAKPAGSIPLEKCFLCEDDSTPQYKGRFKMKFGDDEKDTFYFDTYRKKADEMYDQAAEKERWIAAINQNITAAKRQESTTPKKDHPLIDTDKRARASSKSPKRARSSRGWKVQHGKQKAFRELATTKWKAYNQSAKTGDVVLFHTRGTGPAVIRFGTNSAYDHVGVVVKLKGRPPAVLEALGEGVEMVNISDFRDYDWYKQYTCMSVRRLHGNLTEKQLEQLEEFVKMVIGRKYNLWKPTSLYRRKSTLPAHNPDRAFFCSELVAAAYKQASLLPSHSASCTYFPGSFAESANMMLLGGASLGPEERIIFHKSQEIVEKAAATSDNASSGPCTLL